MSFRSSRSQHRSDNMSLILEKKSRLKGLASWGYTAGLTLVASTAALHLSTATEECSRARVRMSLRQGVKGFEIEVAADRMKVTESGRSASS